LPASLTITDVEVPLPERRDKIKAKIPKAAPRPIVKLVKNVGADLTPSMFSTPPPKIPKPLDLGS